VPISFVFKHVSSNKLNDVSGIKEEDNTMP